MKIYIPLLFFFIFSSCGHMTYTLDDKEEKIYSMEELQNANISNVKILDLNSSNLYQIPHEVYECKNLEVLFLNENQIPTDELGKLASLEKLKILNIGSNGLGSFPIVLGDIKSLEKIALDNNNISIIPCDIVLKLNHVQTIFMPDNPISLEDSNINCINKVKEEIELILDTDFRIWN